MMMYKKKISFLLVITFLCMILLQASSTEVHATTQILFQNPVYNSADPYVIKDGDYYYYTFADGTDKVFVSKTKSLTDYGTVRLVYTFPPEQWNSWEVWGPLALFKWNNEWYMYYCADDGNNVNHRVGVLKANSSDPQGSYTDLGQVNTGGSWAISMSPFQDLNGNWFVTWSGWENPNDGFPQHTYIAPMTNPWTIGNRVKISSPTEWWENSVEGVQEGQIVTRNGNKLFLLYSANGSWTDEYCFGMLTYSGGNILSPTSWVKSGPVFYKTDFVKGPGGPSVVKSNDSTQDWFVYHSNLYPGSGWARRCYNIKQFTWDANGNPYFDIPTPYGNLVNLPSGDMGYKKPTAIAAGYDNKPRILWTFPDGHISLWTMNVDGSVIESTYDYGPFGGWKAISIALGADNKPRVLWSHTNGKISLWTFTTDSSQIESAFDHGPFAGWSGIAVSVGADNKPRILWSFTDGKISLWTMSTNGSIKEAAYDYGPYAGWSGGALSVGPDNKPRVLWNHYTGEVSLWTFSTNGVKEDEYNYGPYGGWSGVSVAVGKQDNKPRILWSYLPTGMTFLWTLSTNGSVKESAHIYGPFADWYAVNFDIGANNLPRINWSFLNQRISLWKMSTDGCQMLSANEYEPMVP